MRELRGFRELRETLARRGDEPMEVVPDATFSTAGFNGVPFGLKSHTIRICNSFLAGAEVYRRLESDEETTDWQTYRKWGSDGYVASGTEEVLLLWRLPEGETNTHPLVKVTYDYSKVARKKGYLITSASARQVPIRGFCRYFGAKAPDIAREIFWELSRIYHRTSDEFENEANRMRQQYLRRERLADNVG